MYNRLKKLREKNNFTQKDISKILGISQSSYSNYETGKAKIPILILSKLAKKYNTSIDFIIGDTNIQVPYKKLST